MKYVYSAYVAQGEVSHSYNKRVPVDVGNTRHIHNAIIHQHQDKKMNGIPPKAEDSKVYSKEGGKCMANSRAGMTGTQVNTKPKGSQKGK